MDVDSFIELSTSHGKFEVFQHSVGQQECVVFINRNYSGVPFLRIHSSCLFSEAFGAQDCDCAIQLNAAHEHIGKNGGLIIYIYQEGRGIGLARKIKAIELEQKEGFNTAQAFKALGHTPDPRQYEVAIEVLKMLDITEVALGTNNPKKVSQLNDAGISVVKRVRLNISPNEATQKYIDSKVQILGHHEEC